MKNNHCKEDFYYSCKAFPRCNILCKRYPKTGIALKLLKVQVLHEKDYTVKETDFSMQVDVKENDVSSISGPDSYPCVNVCILQSGKDGSLTPTDKSILQYYKLNNSTTDIFVIDGDITDLQYCAISKEINRKLTLRKGFNNVLHSLFHCNADDIAIRISMLFEKQLIAGIKSSTADLDIENVEDHNKLDLQYHQLKNVSLRNELICEFGYERNGIDKLFVSIEKSEHKIEVKDYLQTFLPNASNIEIVEFTEIEIANMALKSGDQVKQNKSCGTVGLCLTDGTYHFCATCKHVIDDVDTNNANVIITNSQGESFEINNVNDVFKPSDDLDFMAIRLSNRGIPITYGLKSQFARFVDGYLFGNDMMIPHDQHVYKWGATSKLTNGNFSRIKEKKNLPATVEIKCIESTDFSSPGDSGSLICYSDSGFDFAAFILIGCAKKDATLSFGYKLADAMNACKTCIHPDITACIHLDNELFSNNQ